MEQLDLFELIYPRYFLPKKPRIFEAFAGIDDEDFWKAKKSGISDTQLYKQAGNGIVVDVFASLLDPMIEKLVE